MPRDLLPTDTELAGLGTLEAVRTWVDLDAGVWRAASDALGTVPSMRVLAMSPADSISSVISGLRLPLSDADGHPLLGTDGQPSYRSCSMVESINIALMYGLPDYDIWAPPQLPSAPATPVPGGPQPIGSKLPVGTRKVKVSQISDQLDDTELELLGQEALDEAFRTYRTRMGAEPMKEADPTAEQITVLRCKVVSQGSAPYADFPVLTPFGRRAQKQMKAKGFMLQEDGSWKQLEVPGPPSFESWNACWDIYKTTLLMLKYPATATNPAREVITWAALEEYHVRISKLVKTYPECWHLIMAAEDRCRGEHLERTRRVLVRAALEGRLPMDLPFDNEQPWNGAFMQVSRDMDFWTHEVIIPAQNFLAPGGAGKRMAKDIAEDMDIPQPAKEALDNKTKGAPRPFGQGESKSAKQRRRLKERLSSDQWHSVPGGGQEASDGKGAKGSKGSLQHPRKYGQYFVTTREGTQICYTFAKGQPGSCSEPCPQSRVHCCQLCLGQHPNSQCPKNAKGGNGKGGGANK